MISKYSLIVLTKWEFTDCNLYYRNVRDYHRTAHQDHTHSGPLYTPPSPFTPPDSLYTPSSPFTPPDRLYTTSSPSYTPSDPLYTPSDHLYTPTRPLYSSSSRSVVGEAPSHSPHSRVDSESVECPICSLTFHIDVIERHAATCGDWWYLQQNWSYLFIFILRKYIFTCSFYVFTLWVFWFIWITLIWIS